GVGAFTLWTYATDVNGNVTTLGSKTITCDNANATLPFGTIDVPAQGATVTGTFFNFGWVLTPQPGTILSNGITVFIDGIPAGTATYGGNRTDIAAAFQGLNNTTGAGGSFLIDSTTLANGVHTIAWSVTDDQNRAQGIGSRYFTVAN